jgi:hypothetical protein
MSTVSTMAMKDIRARLSESSRAFLRRATDELEKSPRHAVTDLCAGIELLMKARLAHEHWSLVADRPGDVPLNRIEKGDFISVGFDKAIDRIEVTTASSFSMSDKALLKQLAQHRNKVVHFYHPELDTADTDVLAKAAAEQCRAWLLVERLVTKDWQPMFQAEHESWAALRSLFKRNAMFLKEKFRGVRDELERLRELGTTVVDCRGCGYASAKAEEYSHCVYTLVCLVCDAVSTTARVPCPTCGSIYEEEPEISPYCERCDRYLWASMGLASEAIGHCGSCYGFVPTAHASLVGSMYVCASCLEVDEAVECGVCCVAWIQADEELLQFGCQACGGSY